MDFKSRVVIIAGLAFWGIAARQIAGDEKYANWTEYGGTHENIKYSSLSQIDTSNVGRLKVAWTYHSENNDPSKFGSAMESNPIIIDGVMYVVSPKLKLCAVDAATGEEKWKFDPADTLQNKTWPVSADHMCRGVSYWSDGRGDNRIVYSAGPILFAVNAKTGKLVPTFGKNGGVDLRVGLDRDPRKISVALTSPVKIYKNVVVVGCGQGGDDTPGHIRGFDVVSGKQKWIFHTIPYPTEKGYNTWKDPAAYKTKGSTNPWSGFSLDEKRGIVFAGTGNPTNDFYGGDRLGNGLFGNCILAIDANSGKRIWHYQTVHHDVWDMDISSPPVLITLNRNGKKVDAIAQSTKMGFIFVLDRLTGKPLFPVVERAVKTDGAVPGEVLSPTQPFPTIPKPFVRQILTENDLNTLVPDSSYQDVKRRFHSYRSQGIYTPPSEQGTVILPGYDGGGEWGGPAVDPKTNILYVNANEMTWVLHMVKEKQISKTRDLTNLEAGQLLYSRTCIACHGPDRKGGGEGSIPSLIGINKKYTTKQFIQFVSAGKGRMPSFDFLSMNEKQALAAFILDISSEQQKKYAGPSLSDDSGAAKPSYHSTGYHKFLTREGYPAIAPPWGTISAIDLNTGEYKWKIPFGEFEELKKKGIPATGRENYGGPVVTAGGLLFIGASADGKFRAINKRNGQILWEYALPAPGVATPAVYAIDGKQYVVISAGGSKWEKKKSDAYIAFTLE
jgi:quinoprotein glucose dehydrogenase